jgi:general secretion pathway protein D
MRSKPKPRAVLAKCFLALAITGSPAAALSQSAATSAASTSTGTQTTVSPPAAAPTKRQIDAADAAYLAGARFLDRHNVTAAEAQFEKAAALNPANHEYAVAATVAREHRVTYLVQQAGKARLMGQTDKAEALLAEALALDPQNSIVRQHTAPVPLPAIFHPEIEPWIQQGPAVAGPITLLPNPGTRTIHSRGDVREVVRQVVAAYGIRPVFDDSVVRQDIRLDLDDVSYREATAIVFEMAHSFAVPVDSKSILVIKDTAENRRRYERQLQETIYVPALPPEQMNELKTVVSSVFDIKQASIQNGSGTLVLRAPQETLTAVNLTLADLLDGGAEVLLDLNLYEVDRTHTRNIGVQLPQQIGIYSAEGAARDLVAANQSLVNQAIAQGLIPANASDITIALALISSGLVQSTLFSSTIGFFGGGLTLSGVTATPNTSLHLALNSSDTRALDNLQLRIGDRQTGTFRAGTRYPITTGVYTSGLSGTPSQLAGVTINGVSAASLVSQSSSVSIPQIQYEDLGLTLKATPTVQKSGMVTLHLDLKIEALAGTMLNNIPVLANRQYVSDVTLHAGETALLASSLTEQEAAAVSGLPGIGELPGFQTAAAVETTESDSSELVLLITPHIVRRRSNVIAGPRIALNLPRTD